MPPREAKRAPSGGPGAGPRLGPRRPPVSGDQSSGDVIDVGLAERARRGQESRAWYEDAYDRLDAMTDRIDSALPQLKRDEYAAGLPVIAFCCPRCGGELLAVVLVRRKGFWFVDAAHEGRRSGRAVVVPVDPISSGADSRYDVGAEDFDAIGDLRVRVPCSRSGCSYRGVHRQDSVVKLYVEAYVRGVDAIVLPC